MNPEHKSLILHWHNSYYADCLSHATHLTQDPQAAKDLIQDSFVLLARKNLQYLLKVKNPKAFLFRVIRNNYYDVQRKKNRNPAIVAIDDSTMQLADEEEIAMYEMMYQKFQQYSVRLSNKERVIITMKYFGCNYDLIAHVMKIKKGTVGSRLSEIKKKMKAWYREDQGIPEKDCIE